MNRKLQKEVLRLRPDWRAVSSAFCFVPVGLILCGFAIDRSSGGIYIWRFAYPLFDRMDSIALTFGQRLPYPKDFLPVGKGQESLAASEFVSRTNMYETEVLQLRDPANFLKHIASLGSMENPRVRRAYVMTLVVLRMYTKAIAEAQVLLQCPSIDRLKGFREDLEVIVGRLTANPESARKHLLEWVRSNVRNLGLESEFSEPQ